MTAIAKLVSAATLAGTLAAPAAAQYYPQQQPYPQQYPQTYPQYPQQQYPQTYPQYQQQYPGYGYNQGYANNSVAQVIDQLLGNRYNVTDRQAVARCASAAMSQAVSQYGGGYGQGYGQGYNQGYPGQGYGQGYNHFYGGLHVTAITDVQRRSGGLRVTGLMSRGGQYGNQYGNQYGYQNQGYATGDVSFRCNVDYRGAVTNIRIGHNRPY